MLPDTLDALYKVLKSRITDLEARRIIEARTLFGWAEIMSAPDTVLSAEMLAAVETDVTRREAGEPLSRIYGTREFWGLEFKVTPDTLDPRPDTELIIELALKRLKDNPPRRILDMGTGTGCILISLLKEFPQARGVACDISEAALDVARENARRHGVEDRAEFIQSDWFENIRDDYKSGFDLIVSNPPYIAESVIPELESEVKNHDPILALEGGEDGLQAYRKIFSGILPWFAAGGLGLFEIGFDQGETVMRLSEESRLWAKALHRDLAGQARVVELAPVTSSGDK